MATFINIFDMSRTKSLVSKLISANTSEKTSRMILAPQNNPLLHFKHNIIVSMTRRRGIKMSLYLLAHARKSLI